MTCSPLEQQMLRWPWLQATWVLLLLLALGAGIGVQLGMLMRNYIEKFANWVTGTPKGTRS